jgi:hypothetical protein
MKVSLGMLLIVLVTLSACGVPSAAAPSTIEPADTPPPPATRMLHAAPTSTPVAKPDITPVSLSLAVPTSDPTLTAWQSKYRIVGYYPAWSNPPRDPAASELPGNMLTHVIYAFSSIDPKTRTCVFGAESVDQYHLKNLGKLKQKYPHLKVLIAIGGATRSKEFSDMASDEKSVRSSCSRASISTSARTRLSLTASTWIGNFRASAMVRERKTSRTSPVDERVPPPTE